MPAITVVIPTLAADESLARCLESLRAQTYRDFETVVVDNSGGKRVPDDCADRVIHSRSNRGFGGAINDAAHQTDSEFLMVLNDDTAAGERCLEELARAAAAHPEAGMFAARVRLSESELDSAGMLLCADGTSKQRGHGEPPDAFGSDEEVLLASGSAAMYRRPALAESGLFDEDFFLYCEDTDLGLRLRWAGWSCRYVAGAVVDHHYSRTAGRASTLKAYLVERNRWRVVVKNFPLSMWPGAIAATMARYLWHATAMRSGRGIAGAYRAEGGSGARLAWIAMKAALALIPALPGLLAQRAAMARRIDGREFRALASRFAISPREVAAQ